MDLGNSVVLIEHNLDVIKSADWIIDMGPEAGAKGGTIAFTGTPEELAATTPKARGKKKLVSHTAPYLANALRSSLLAERLARKLLPLRRKLQNSRPLHRRPRMFPILPPKQRALSRSKTLLHVVPQNRNTTK